MVEKSVEIPYPKWICHKCGVKYGRKACGIACWHEDHCGVVVGESLY
jgi:hypothetical protein